MKFPKVYIRNSGLLHGLPGVRSFDDLIRHSIIGKSSDGVVLENLINGSPLASRHRFKRTLSGAKIILVLGILVKKTWVFEMMHGRSGKPSKGLDHTIEG